jgi:hypothetical protein
MMTIHHPTTGCRIRDGHHTAGLKIHQPACLVTRKSFIGREFMKKGRIKGIEKGIEKGRSEGLAPLERQFERRLGRPLAVVEHTELLRRLDTLGAARLGDVVLDMDAAALAAWIADPDAR